LGRFAERGGDRRRHRAAKEFDHGDQNEIRKDTATHHQARNAGPNDIADTEKRRVICKTDRTALECLIAEFVGWRSLPKREDLHQGIKKKTDTEADGDNLSALQGRVVGVGGVALMRRLSRLFGRASL